MLYTFSIICEDYKYISWISSITIIWEYFVCIFYEDINLMLYMKCSYNVIYEMFI